MRVLILGATGLLGRALVEEWRSEDVIAVGRRVADIRDMEQVRTLLAHTRLDWTVLAAAYTNVDGCESNPELAREVNCVGAANVARAVRECRSRLLFVSTDYVFGGEKSAPYEVDDPIGPINAYGRSKAAGEQAVREILPDCCIVRTSWLFGVDGTCFPNTVLRLAESQKELRVVADERGCPTLNLDLACAIVQLVHAGARGTVHVTNSGDCTRVEFAEELVRCTGLTGVTVTPIRTEELARPARRPKYSVLSDASLRSYGIGMRPWREALCDYLNKRQASATCRQAAVHRSATPIFP